MLHAHRLKVYRYFLYAVVKTS